MPIEPLEGRVFGRLTVLSFDSARNGSAYWLCRCECGREVVVRANGMKTGNTQSCGCLNAQRRREAKAHGKANSRSYRVWMDMMGRCYRPTSKAYSYYGGRGITVHPWWHQFINFYVDMGDPPDGMELDRKDTNGGYVAWNCRWVTSQQNSMNTGKLKPTASRFKGVQRTSARWAARIKFNRKSIHIGCFDTEEEAAKAYDAKARELFGEFACCNFSQGSVAGT